MLRSLRMYTERRHPGHDLGAAGHRPGSRQAGRGRARRGVRRGDDVVKALALGARAVMTGRAYLRGLAADGQAGAENVLDILRGGIDSALLGLGHSSVHDLTPDDLAIPPGFTRALGTGQAAGRRRAA